LLVAISLGLQFHIEIDSSTLERWLDEDAAFVIGALGENGPARIREEAQQWLPLLRQQGRQLIANLYDQLNGL
jgi:GMP synthase (glutamine-hydrolysing)